MSEEDLSSPSESTALAPKQEFADESPFAAFAFRLNVREWTIVFIVVLIVILLTPVAWKKVERFETSPDYRIPYSLSKDYWLYNRRLSEVASEKPVFVIGDSVVWGEYVTANGTLSHHLSEQAPGKKQFINAGVNGLFPLALEGLVRYYGSAIKNQKVALHCNLLWLSSPRADLSSAKEEKFNHPRLVPQWSPALPCYRATVEERLEICLERQVSFLQWVNHLQNAYFDQMSIYAWTLADDGDYPPVYPNANKNPILRIRTVTPSEPLNDPQRGILSARHKPWSTTGVGTQNFEWVKLEDSLQWRALVKLVSLLEERGNDVLIIVGPFNEHIMTPENAAMFRQLQTEAVEQIRHGRTVVVPRPLASELYGDASHPLTEGYRILAQQLLEDAEFLRWLNQP